MLIQSFCNIFIQLILLKIALDHRPPPSSKGGDAALPFAGAQDGLWGFQRPYNFWQWRSPKPYVPSTHREVSRFLVLMLIIYATCSYWQFLLALFIGLTILELLLAPFDSIYPGYSALIGYIGLSVEATLPLPQLIANARLRSCKGFRFSVLASWLVGDAMKMFWFFTSTSEIPWAFKLCGIFQAVCDFMLGVQYLMYGDQQPTMKAQQMWPPAAAKPHLSPSPYNGRQTPTGRRTPVGEKTI